jgi:2-haloacid dehalogenase
MSVSDIKAIVFDTFGTVMNWRISVIEDFRLFGQRKAIDRNWEAFVDEWRTAYRPGMDAVRSGQWPWTTVDRIYRMKLDELLPQYELNSLSEDERVYLNRVWHRLAPWPDAVAGLTRLKKQYVIAPLSNSDFDCLVNMAKHAGLPWEAIQWHCCISNRTK